MSEGGLLRAVMTSLIRSRKGALMEEKVLTRNSADSDARISTGIPDSIP